MQRCQGCGLLQNWCCCEHIHSQLSQIRFILLLNENEPERPTTTSHIIQHCLPDSRAFIWQRGVVPDELISTINAPDTQAWLLFPADRAELNSRQQSFRPDPTKKTLIIVPDGTWKEVRKIVRKSPWLDQLPIIAFNPQTESRYNLRRNDHANQLCTAEAVRELLLQGNEVQAAGVLDNAFEWFIHRYVEQQNHRQATSPEHLFRAGTEPQ